MRGLLYWSLGVSCLGVAAILIVGMVLRAWLGPEADALAGDVMGVVYLPALYVTILLSENAHRPSVALLIIALVAQTFLMAMAAGCLLERWRLRAGRRETQEDRAGEGEHG